MALRNCKDCNKEVSTDASSCPYCGADLASKTVSIIKSLFGIIALVLVAISMGALILSLGC